MAADTYMPSLMRTYLSDYLAKILLTEQEAKDLIIRIKADPMIIVYQDCLFGKEVFHAKNVGIRSKDHILSQVESEKRPYVSFP
ncbi:hypothetical protein RclHR1_05900004 [Rhizophagus clarus]|nr:hypothetical protein RclHR1_05900004 [Rhizophagus clarus]